MRVGDPPLLRKLLDPGWLHQAWAPSQHSLHPRRANSIPLPPPVSFHPHAGRRPLPVHRFDSFPPPPPPLYAAANARSSAAQLAAGCLLRRARFGRFFRSGGGRGSWNLTRSLVESEQPGRPGGSEPFKKRANVAPVQWPVGRARIRIFLVQVPLIQLSRHLDPVSASPSACARRGIHGDLEVREEMDDDDYSWVRRTRFSHSVVRSNSGREQFGAFVEQFNRGAVLKQKGSASGFKLHGLNMEPGTRLSGSTGSATSSVPRTSSRSAMPKPKGLPSHAELDRHEKAVDVRPPQEAPVKQDDAKAANGKKGIINLSVAVNLEPVAHSPEDGSPGPLDFSFHPDEESLSLQRACSSPAPFPRMRTPGGDILVRSSSLHVLGEAPRLKQRARSPLPTRDDPDVFREAKSTSKRFSTPPPRRRSGSLQALNEISPVPRASGKLKQRKECLANGRARVAALEVLEKWSVDRSQLLIGHRFASGAHSRLFHGIYKEQPVAVKFIRQPDDEEDAELAAQLEKQFNTEVATLSRLNHPNVIKLVGACSSPPVFCVITEFLSGGSLRTFLHKLDHKSLPLDKIISISLDIAHGMAYIHSQGVVHRDVKPENIIFDGEGCAKIVDFGIACEEAYCDPLANDTGTFRWMAPEMMKHKSYGRKVDVYSFGLILWEMFSGSIPYEDLTPFQAAFAVFDKNVRQVIPTSCPAPVRLLIEQCWASHPEKRPEFWQIVQILEKFKMVLDRDGTLDNMPSSGCQETHDHKNWLAHWVQKLKHSPPDFSGPPPPKLL